MGIEAASTLLIIGSSLKDSPKPPGSRVTLTMPAINSAEKVCLGSGPRSSFVGLRSSTLVLINIAA